ncbi:hypothetical protein M404DRAFT_991322, partial [Pisolithus tinctorius Marx 270]
TNAVLTHYHNSPFVIRGEVFLNFDDGLGPGGLAVEACAQTSNSTMRSFLGCVTVQRL